MLELEHPNKTLYLTVRDRLCRQIFEGVYPDGTPIPSERTLAEEFGVSRVTVRKALDLLEQEHIVSRVQGSGTRVSLYLGPRPGDLEIITVVAPAQNQFFARVIDAVQTCADARDSLLLFQQKPDGIPLEKCLFRIYRKGLRNLILWKEDLSIAPEALLRLKGLGMRIVLFDEASADSALDTVCLDNAGAVKMLADRLAPDPASCTFVTWDNPEIGSLRAREKKFLSLFPDGKVIRIPYRYHNLEQSIPEEILKQVIRELKNASCVLYAVGELGIVCESAARRAGIFHKAGMIGMMQGARELEIQMVEQDFSAMAEQICLCLEEQNRIDSGWRPRHYSIPGVFL